MAVILPQAPDDYDDSNERRLRRALEDKLSDIDRKLSSILTTFGTLALGSTDITLVNGTNSDIPIGYTTYVRVSGPSANFTVTGFTGGAKSRLLVLRNTTAQQMTITNEATSTATNRITTQTGADVVLVGAGGNSATLLYDATSLRWVLIGTQG